ncbi:MAG: hypothetical protein AAGA53_15230 [Pseudomonadota bacterium]
MILQVLLAAGLIFMPVNSVVAEPSDFSQVLPTDAHVADVAETWTLVKTERDGSILRVSFHKLGPLPISDLSPDHHVALSIHVLVPETSVARGTWIVANVIDMVPPVRRNAGIYELKYTTYSTDPGACWIVEKVLIIDAREATLEGRSVAANLDSSGDHKLASVVSKQTVNEICVTSR